MGHSRIDDIKLAAKDRSGYDINCIYALNPPEYAVYGTEVRVALQYADDKELARQQRSALAACSPLRGQINGLIDGWRGEGRHARPKRVTDYDRRVADALVVALEGAVPNALDLLAEIRNDIVAERRSIAQSDYLLTAVITVLALLVIAAFVRSLPIFSDAAAGAATAAMTGSTGGTLGAFFSIAVGLRGRTVLVDLQKWDNRRDAILRVVVGTIGGAILICLFLTGLVSALKIEAGTLTAPAGVGPLTALVIGFLAGFSERAVPDILAKASLATDAATSNGSSDVATDHARAAAIPAMEQPRAGGPGAAAGDVTGERSGGEAPVEGEDSDADEVAGDPPPEMPVDSTLAEEPAEDGEDESGPGEAAGDPPPEMPDDSTLAEEPADDADPVPRSGEGDATDGRNVS
jgi:hypothetical protein